MKPVKKKKPKRFAPTTILKYLNAKCEKCAEDGITNTENLTLDHINRVPSDNRLKNLRILCLKCHRNKDQWRKKDWR